MEEDAHAPGASGDTATEASPTPSAVDAGSGTNVERSQEVPVVETFFLRLQLHPHTKTLFRTVQSPTLDSRLQA